MPPSHCGSPTTTSLGRRGSRRPTSRRIPCRAKEPVPVSWWTMRQATIRLLPYRSPRQEAHWYRPTVHTAAVAPTLARTPMAPSTVSPTWRDSSSTAMRGGMSIWNSAGSTPTAATPLPHPPTVMDHPTPATPGSPSPGRTPPSTRARAALTSSTMNRCTLTPATTPRTATSRVGLASNPVAMGRLQYASKRTAAERPTAPACSCSAWRANPSPTRPSPPRWTVCQPSTASQVSPRPSSHTPSRPST